MERKDEDVKNGDSQGKRVLCCECNRPVNTKRVESPTSQWYRDKRFATFWKHYNIIMRVPHHEAIMRARHIAASLTPFQDVVHHNHSNKFRLSQQASHISANPYKAKYKKNKSKKKQKNRKNKERSSRNVPENQSDTESLYSQMRASMKICDYIEVTEDFLQFLEQSKKHREEWKVAKALKNKQELNLNTTEVVADVKTKEHPDVIRSREMQQLYGQAAPKLQAMETALQLSFDRNVMLYQPQCWPNIPLNVMFT